MSQDIRNQNSPYFITINLKWIFLLSVFWAIGMQLDGIIELFVNPPTHELLGICTPYISYENRGLISLIQFSSSILVLSFLKYKNWEAPKKKSDIVILLSPLEPV